ncbi:MAG TPA: hypothetical protein VM282_24165 [Acidimicrobiales bacterium]|nr:hypothetical protein [Acidimicrobiales bacterium]
MLVVLAVVVAIAAATRSTWSPCGQSMLSQINPIAEAGRRQRYRRTVGWFIAGAVLGGVTLGGLSAGLAVIVDAAGLGHRGALALAAMASFAAALIDARALGFGPPFLRRQVNEDWLSRYRPWVYGGGFGWQIGVGITTYIMTAAVPLTIVYAALSASPWVALIIGVLFGLARGLTVLLSARLRTQSDLYAFHRRFAAAGDRVRRAVIVAQLAVAVCAAWAAAPTLVAVGITVVAAGFAVWASSRTLTERAETHVTARQLASDM